MSTSAAQIVLLVLLTVASSAATAHAGLLDRIRQYGSEITSQETAAPDSAIVADGLKEALTVGTVNAVMNVSRTDGYFGNPAIRIPLPENARKAAKVMSSLGMQQQVDEFILTMNRAAEKAAPRAKELFISAVRQMTFRDALEILKGGDTAATDYLRSKTSQQLYSAFRPVVTSAMGEVGVTRAYKRMMDKVFKTRLVRAEDVDLDHHVTSRALDGLFRMVGEEEKNIRKDPAARVTELLKKVFANQ